ncbi:MAG: cation transporter [Bacteroidetes bacterium]|nr:cation transporter [Bacteroidota bacterium]
MLSIILVVGILLFFLKIWLYWITQSNAILSDALESTVNVFAGAFALYSLILANKPSDKKHPYGHGKIEFLSASIEGALIIAAGLIIIVKSIYNFYNPAPIESLELGIIFTLLSGGVNLLMGLLLINRGKKVRSLLMRASGKHLMSDAYTSAGLIIGLVIIHFTDLLWLDGVVAIVFGGIIIYSGYQILSESIDGIMDGADFETLDKLVNHLQTVRKEDWIDIHKMRMIKYGTFLHFDCHVTVPRFYTIEEGHAVIDKIEEEIAATFNNQAEVFIHVDACIPASCKHCRMESCAVRAVPRTEDYFWKLDTVLENKKYGL